MEIPPQGAARSKTGVLGLGGAAWPAGPTESRLLSVSNLACRGGAAAFFGFGAERPSKRLRICYPSCNRESSCAGRSGTAAPRGGRRAPRRGWRQARPGGTSAIGLPPPRAASAKPSPTREAPGPLGPEAGPLEPRAPGAGGAAVGLRTQEVSAGRGLGSLQAVLLWILEERGAQACALGC